MCNKTKNRRTCQRLPGVKKSSCILLVKSSRRRTHPKLHFFPAIVLSTAVMAADSFRPPFPLTPPSHQPKAIVDFIKLSVPVPPFFVRSSKPLCETVGSKLCHSSHLRSAQRSFHLGLSLPSGVGSLTLQRWLACHT